MLPSNEQFDVETITMVFGDINCNNHSYNAFHVDKIHSYEHNDSGMFFDSFTSQRRMDSKWNDC